MSILISCEVGGDHVPSPLVNPGDPHTSPAKSTRKGKLKPGELPSHLASDVPARYVARRLANQLNAPLVENEYSLDLIDVTRSPKHRQLFPSLTRSWPAADRKRLIEQIHSPYRERVRKSIAQVLLKFPYAIHLSIRTYEPSHRGKMRRADAGLLYDPAREDEVDFCLDWIDEMYDALPMLKVRRNYPRRGTTDSITKAMRTEFKDQFYIGIEVLLNRAWAGRPVAIRDEVIDGISQTLRELTQCQKTDAA